MGTLKIKVFFFCLDTIVLGLGVCFLLSSKELIKQNLLIEIFELFQVYPFFHTS